MVAECSCPTLGRSGDEGRAPCTKGTVRRSRREEGKFKSTNLSGRGAKLLQTIGDAVQDGIGGGACPRGCDAA
jgi:hypothetical protein